MYEVSVFLLVALCTDIQDGDGNVRCMLPRRLDPCFTRG